MQNALHEFVRINGSFYSVEAQNRYRALRKVNAVYYRCMDKCMGEDDAIAYVLMHTTLSERAIRALIVEGRAFRYYDSTDSSVLIEEDGELFEERYFIGEHALDPGIIVSKALFMDEVVDAIEKLSYRQRRILCESCGGKCIYCGRVGKRKNYAKLANELELYSESAVEKQRKAAVKVIMNDLKDARWFDP
jgi:hypothetical protein